ncbi:MAG TPA: hypothetical protein VHU86_10320 [Solirubrobacterales bacterium]|jgi:hypothetical protein|nr:hypothetical protein [Solirubrobacterales bacterium]
MLSAKIRTAVVTLIAASSLLAALAAPAASQAQWHTIVIDGHVFTHGNFTEGSVSPCTRIEGQLGSWQQAVGDYKEWVERHDRGEATAKEELENAEGEANRASGEAFEYGCDTVAAAKPSSPKPRRHAGPGRVTTTDSTR